MYIIFFFLFQLRSSTTDQQLCRSLVQRPHEDSIQQDTSKIHGKHKKMIPLAYHEKFAQEKRIQTYRANVRKRASIVRHLLSTGLTKPKEVERAYQNLFEFNHMDVWVK
ncbi:MAG: hypothetical protein CMI56_00060 [Parcubacteria group bacterium]|nr:hypothetical protein [Parcubacteria group bacterium]